jgi:hypothetical protein
MKIRKSESCDVAIVQPLVPSYRKPFFEGLREKVSFDLYVYYDEKFLKKNNFSPAGLPIQYLGKWRLGKAIFLNVFPLLKKQYKIIVLCAEMKLITNWLVLIFGRFFDKKVILWGHGFNACKYFKETEKIPLVKKVMYHLADGAWFYTGNEEKIWQNEIFNLKSVALNNTVEVSLSNKSFSDSEIKKIKDGHKIKNKFNFIFCARFNNKNRHIELLNQIINKVDKNKFGFIIIGDGKYKSDLIKSENVYDFGSIYDSETKSELFSLADVYFQPAWCGLSIVEAMAYGKPIFTFKRSEEILQCVEYGYIEHGVNGIIFKNINEMIVYLSNFSLDDIQRLSRNAKRFYREKLSMNSMISNAVEGIELVRGK